MSPYVSRSSKVGECCRWRLSYMSIEIFNILFFAHKKTRTDYRGTVSVIASYHPVRDHGSWLGFHKWDPTTAPRRQLLCTRVMIFLLTPSPSFLVVNKFNHDTNTRWRVDPGWTGTRHPPRPLHPASGPHMLLCCCGNHMGNQGVWPPFAFRAARHANLCSFQCARWHSSLQ